MKALERAAGVATLLCLGSNAHALDSEARPKRDGGADSDSASSRSTDTQTTLRDQWQLALEGSLRAPIDVGVELLLDTPFGLRAFAGYGWIPPAYIDTFADAAVSGARARTVLDNATFTGKTWRLGSGVRPFSEPGIYLDAGYARVLLDGSFALETTEIGSTAGGYLMHTQVHTWLAELGYQTQVGGRLVLGIGLGATGTVVAETAITATDGAPAGAALSRAAREIDDTLESYRILPTLTLRLGIDLI